MPDAFAVRVSVLNTGLGMANMIETFLTRELFEQNKPSKIALIDFGGDVSRGEAVERVLDALKRKGDRVLDLVIISHSDKDHWGLLSNLSESVASFTKLNEYLLAWHQSHEGPITEEQLEKLKKDAKNWAKNHKSQAVRINKLILGGNFDKYGKNQDIIKGHWLQAVAGNLSKLEELERLLGKFAEGPVYGVPAGYSSYPIQAGVGIRPLIPDFDGVVFNTLVANVPAAGNRLNNDDIRANSATLVVVASMWGEDMIFTGDATSETMQQANFVMFNYGNAIGGNPGSSNPPHLPVISTTMMTVPHHGSLRTAEDAVPAKAPGRRAAKKPATYMALGNFQQLTQPQAIVASAGPSPSDSGRAQPVALVLSVLGNDAHGHGIAQSRFEHDIVVYTLFKFVSGQGWQTVHYSVAPDAELPYRSIFTTRFRQSAEGGPAAPNVADYLFTVFRKAEGERPDVVMQMHPYFVTGLRDLRPSPPPDNKRKREEQEEEARKKLKGDGGGSSSSSSQDARASARPASALNPIAARSLGPPRSFRAPPKRRVRPLLPPTSTRSS